jgi:hypothetical protein
MSVTDSSQEPRKLLSLPSKTANIPADDQYTTLENLLNQAIASSSQFKDIEYSLDNILQDLIYKKSNKHITCLVILPFNDRLNDLPFLYEAVLLPALRNVLEQAPYYWQLAYSNDRSFDDTIDLNIEAWMKRAQAYLVDTSDRDPDVMMELGSIRRAKRQQPLIVLERDGTNHLPDKSGITRISYPNANGTHAIDEISEALGTAFGEKSSIQELNSTKKAHYLSPLLLRNELQIGDDQLAKDLARVYVTMEAFSVAKVKDICRNVRGLSNHAPLATGYKNAVASLLKESKN